VTSDPIAGPFLEKLARAAQPGGIIFAYGALYGQLTPFPLLAVLSKGLSVRGYTLMEITLVPEKLAIAKEIHLRAVGQWAISPEDRKDLSVCTDGRSV